MEIFSIENILGALVNSFAYVFIWSKLLNQKINFKDYKYYIYQLLFALLMIVNFYFVNGFFRIITLFLILMLFCLIITNKSIKESLFATFVSEIVIIISEIIFALIITIFYTSNVYNLYNFFSGKLVTNVVISLISFLLMKFDLFKKIYVQNLKTLLNVQDKIIIMMIVILLLSFNILFLFLYKDINLFTMLIINSILLFVYLFICFKFLKTENEYSKINDKYNNTLNSLKEYEDILDVYRVSSHENKNQLLMIRNMILKEEKDIPEYIDKIIDNKIKDDEKLMFDTNKIPAGGLRAVVYSKLLVMKDEKIDFNLIVDRKVRTVDLIELGESLMLDVCRITGVFLDNAIEEVKNKDNKKIIVELFTDEDKLCIRISNNFSGSINIEKIYDKGYTTKTDGHGYGLSLVKEIIEKNNKLTNMTSIENGMFTQMLEIKVK